MIVLTPIPEQARLVKTVIIQETARSSWTRPSAPGCGDTSKASASSCSISGGDQGTWLWGRYRLGHWLVVLLRRIETAHGKASGKPKVRAQPPVTVGTERGALGRRPCAVQEVEDHKRKTPGAEGALDKEWEKVEKFPAWQLTKVKRQKKF